MGLIPGHVKPNLMIKLVHHVYGQFKENYTKMKEKKTRQNLAICKPTSHIIVCVGKCKQLKQANTKEIEVIYIDLEK